MSTHPDNLYDLANKPGGVDVTSTDPYEMARLWSVEAIGTRNGLIAIPIREHCFLRQHNGMVETGQPGDVLVVHNQKMTRRVVSEALFEFLFGEKLT